MAKIEQASESSPKRKRAQMEAAAASEDKAAA